MPRLDSFEIDHKSAAWTPLESAQNPGYFAPRLASNPWATGGGRQAHRGYARLAGSNRLQAANCAPAEAPIGLDFTAQKSERPVMPQDTRAGRRVVLDGLDLPSLPAGLGADLRGCSAKLALTRFPVPRSRVRTPVPDLWRAFGRNPARSGSHGERNTRQRRRRSRKVCFCRHPSRP